MSSTCPQITPNSQHLPRVDVSPALIPLLNPSPDWSPLTPQELSTYAFVATTFIETQGELPDTKHVPAIAAGFRDPEVMQWYSDNRAYLNRLSLRHFLDELRAEFLPKNWALDLHTSILTRSQGEGEHISQWIRRLQADNFVLRDTVHHIDDRRLLSHLKTHLKPALAKLVEEHPDTNEMYSLEAWSCAVAKLENDIIVIPATPDSWDTLTPAHGLEKLSERQRKWICARDGCFKCRRIRVKHVSEDCPFGYPDKFQYRGITNADGISLAKGAPTC